MSGKEMCIVGKATRMRYEFEATSTSKLRWDRTFFVEVE